MKSRTDWGNRQGNSARCFLYFLNEINDLVRYFESHQPPQETRSDKYSAYFRTFLFCVERLNSFVLSCFLRALVARSRVAGGSTDCRNRSTNFAGVRIG